MEGKSTPLCEAIPNKTWKGNSPIVRGYAPTKGSGSDPHPNNGDTGNNQED
jgi:hypothetical protein